MVSSGKHEQISDVICVQARQIRIESERVIPVQLDGDPAGGTPIEINVEPDSCELFVPSSFGTR